jgi:hypothetical protein
MHKGRTRQHHVGSSSSVPDEERPARKLAALDALVKIAAMRLAVVAREIFGFAI